MHDHKPGKETATPANPDINTPCIKKSLYSYECQLQYFPFTDKDVGEHVAVITLLDYPEKSIKLAATVIKPSKPDE